MELIVDTALEPALLALSEKGRVFAHLCFWSDQNHTRRLLPHLHRLLQSAGIDLRDLEAIIVARGPGESFNGLRSGIALAKALAFSLRAPLVAISTFELLAFPHLARGSVISIWDLGRERAGFALFERPSEIWRDERAERVSTYADLLRRIPAEGDVLVCGKMGRELFDLLRRKLGGERIREGIPAGRALILGQVGAEKLRAGRTETSISLKPLYLKPPSITLRKKP